jgi:hypothetical protein
VSDGITAKVEWLNGSDQALAELGKKSTEKNVLVRTLKKAAQPIDDAASAFAPVDTGKLQISIITGTQLTRRQRSSAYKNGTAGSRRGSRRDGDEPRNVPGVRHVQAAGAAVHAACVGCHQGTRRWSIIGTELWIEIRKAAERAARKQAKIWLMDWQSAFMAEP